MAPTQHALLSASASKRWLNCTPSARLEAELPESTSSYADEGTDAHHLSELKLLLFNKEIDRRSFNSGVKKLKEGNYYSAEMEEVTDAYVDAVKQIFTDAKKRNGEVQMWIEKRIDYSGWAEEGFGTGDNVIVSGDELWLGDLKYGQGVPVNAEWNTQLILYALGILDELEFSYDIKTVHLTIYQLRIDNVSTWTTTPDELYRFATDNIIEKAKAAFKGEGVRVAGEHCRFCKLEQSCPARANHYLEMAKQEFGMPPDGLDIPSLMEPEQLANLLGLLPEWMRWAKSVQDYALEQAMSGTVIPGWKVVNGKGRRVWAEEEHVKSVFAEQGLTENQYIRTELKTIGDMEKVFGKKVLAGLAGITIWQEGKPTLVPEEDKRVELGSEAAARRDFGITEEGKA